MFDLTSSKLLILAVVALIVVGPKDLPALMRTVGRYLGMIRRQANEFRAQFEDAMRESELADLKKEVEQLGEDARNTIHETGSAVESQVGDVTREMNETLAEIDKPAAPSDTPTERTPEPASTFQDEPAQVTHESMPHDSAPVQEPAPAPVAETVDPSNTSRSGA